MTAGQEDVAALRFGFEVAVITAVLTVVTFGTALMAVPNSGRNCRADCVGYPFAGDVLAREFPGDYLWMFPAMALMVAFVAFMAAIHGHVPEPRRVFSLLGLCLAVLAAAVLLVDYFIQVTVLQPSLTKGSSTLAPSGRSGGS